MKMTPLCKISMMLLMILLISKMSIAQVDTAAAMMVDTAAKVQEPTKTAEKKKKSSSFIAYGGVTFNEMNTPPQYESTSDVGWALGVAYRRGRFFYWQVGARYNNAIYGIADQAGTTPDEITSITIKDIDIPINVGLNLLSVTDNILGLRVYLGAVPSFLIGVSDNNVPNFTKSNANSFNFYGQAGIGIDVLFLSVDAGYNAGFTDALKNMDSKPGQVFVNLGFRF
jgi:hypothetical protein